MKYMDQNTHSTQPPPPPSNEPADIFEGSSENASDSASSTGFEAIDFSAVNEQLDRFIEYVQETRTDFEAGGTSQGWIDQLFAQLKEVQSAVRSFEIDHAEDAVQRDEGDGRMTEIVLRKQDPDGFDAVATRFEGVAKKFQDYFEKHREMKLGLK